MPSQKEQPVVNFRAPKDMPIKCDMASMVDNIFPLSDVKKAFTTKDGVSVIPSVLGAATQNDRDLYIFLFSKAAYAYEYMKIDNPNVIAFTAKEYLRFTGRQTHGGRSYSLFKLSLDRLVGHRISLRLADTTGLTKRQKNIGIIAEYEIAETIDDRREVVIEALLPDHTIEAIKTAQMLTLTPSYFSLNKLESKIYEIGRKQCGNQKMWLIGFDKLQQMIGSQENPRKLRWRINSIIESGGIPDYRIDLVKSNRSWMVYFYKEENREIKPQEKAATPPSPPLLNIPEIDGDEPPLTVYQFLNDQLQPIDSTQPEYEPNPSEHQWIDLPAMDAEYQSTRKKVPKRGETTSERNDNNAPDTVEKPRYVQGVSHEEIMKKALPGESYEQAALRLKKQHIERLRGLAKGLSNPIGSP